jgi:RNA binding exosome subunit
LSVLDKSIELVEQDKKTTFRIAGIAHEYADKQCSKFFEAHRRAIEAHDFEPIAEHINSVIVDTKTFGLAQVLVQELTGITDTLNEQLDKTKPLFGKIDKEKQAKAETYRAVFMAHWLRAVVDELAKELK